MELSAAAICFVFLSSIPASPSEPNGQHIMVFINCVCVHEIRMNDGRSFPPSGIVVLLNGEPKYPWAKLRNMPDQKEGVTYIVSERVFLHLKGGKRKDFVTRNFEGCRRNDDGRIIAFESFLYP